jgi:hypothetical protein
LFVILISLSPYYRKEMDEAPDGLHHRPLFATFFLPFSQ